MPRCAFAKSPDNIVLVNTIVIYYKQTLRRISNIMREELKEKIKEYFENRKDVIAVYLFGSYARGKERNLSDIDLGILLEGGDPGYFAEKRNDFIVELGRITRKDIDPVIMNTAGQVVLKQIFLKGNCLLVKDSKKLARYKTVMFAGIAELGFYRRHMQSGLIQKIMEESKIG